MKKYEKNILMTFIVLVFLCMFSGCSPDVTSDKQIFQDFEELEIYSQYNVTFDKIEILKRMTNEEDKVDKVYLWVSGGNDDVKFEQGFELIYYLYNDGWRLEDYGKFEGERVPYIHPLSGVQQEVADAYIANKYENATLIGQDFDSENNSCTFQYDIKEVANYMTKTTTIELAYFFSISKGWGWSENPIETELEQISDWNINGTWTYSYYSPSLFNAPDTEVTAEITVNSYDGTQWTGDYSIQYDQYEHFAQSESGTFQTKNNEFIFTVAEYITGNCEVGFKFDETNGMLCVHSHGGDFGNKMTRK